MNAIARGLFLVIPCCLCLTAAADQFAWISGEVAEKASAMLPLGTEVRYFCEPAGDTVPVADIVHERSVRMTGVEEYHEILVNGQGIDLAYVYVQKDGAWKNLAMLLGLKPEDVSEVLPEFEEGHEEDYGYEPPRTLHGTIGENLPILMKLMKFDLTTLNGNYQYLKHGKLIELDGTVDTEGAFTLTELTEGKKTGVFNGAMKKDMASMDGSWMSADGKKTLPFKAALLAEQTEDTVENKVGKTDVWAHVSYPTFQLDDDAFEKRLNAAVKKQIFDARAEWLKSASESLKEYEPPEEFDQGYSYDLAEYSIEYFSDSLVSISYIGYEYSGGAHGMTWFNPINYRVSDGKLLPVYLENVLDGSETALKKVSDYLIAELKKREATFVVNGDVTGFEPLDLVNFTLSAQGIKFLFDPYAVASYAEGTFEVVVPFKVLEGHLNRNTLKGLLPEPK